MEEYTVKRATMGLYAKKDHDELSTNPNLATLEMATGKGDFTKFDILGKGPLWDLNNRSKVLKLVTGTLCPRNTQTCTTCGVTNTDIHQLLYCTANRTRKLLLARATFWD